MACEDDESFALNVAPAEAARLRLERTASYPRPGRVYASMSDAELATLWITAVRNWAATPAERPPAIDDAGAAFAMQGRDPPYALARDEIGRLAAWAMARVARMTAADRRTEREQILSRYRDERAQKN
jgi:hypothetical protein